MLFRSVSQSRYDSLYLALFQLCNLIYFQSFISISQHEMIKLCRIAVFGTYHKRIKDIKSFPQIEYLPSFNSCKKSLLNLYNFDERAVQNLNSYHTKNQTSSEQALNQHHIKIDTGIEQALIPSINYINLLNYKHNSITTPAYRDWETDRKSTRLNSSHRSLSRMPSSA